MQLTYDAVGRLTSAADALNRRINFTYSAQGRITAAQDFTGRKTAYEYDAFGNLIAATDFAGSRNGYYTDSTFLHLLKTTTMPTNKITAFEYYANRKAARAVEPGGRTARFLYLPLRNDSVVIDGRGFATSFFYTTDWATSLALSNRTVHARRVACRFIDDSNVPAQDLARHPLADAGGSIPRTPGDNFHNTSGY